MARTLMTRFTTTVSNSFMSPLEKSHSCRFRIIESDFLFYIENGILREAILMKTHSIPSGERKSIRYPYFASCPGAMINTL